jgi:clan AA aspartic protease
VIVGVVRPGREAVIWVTVRGPGGGVREIDAIVDTGFNGFVTLPSRLVDALGLTSTASSQGFLADGSTVLFDVYEVAVLWDGRWITVEAGSLDGDPLVGMDLLAGFRLCLDAIDGGGMTIEALS